MSLVAISMFVLPVLMIGGWLRVVWSSGVSDRAVLLLRFAVGWGVWALGWLGLAVSGVLAAKPQLFLGVMPSMIVLTLVVTRSRLGEVLAGRTALCVLVGMQSFRLPLELVMHQAALDGLMPMQMTFGASGLGHNYDLVTGASAFVLALVLRRRELPKAVTLVWNVVGFALLVNIVVVAVMSTPMFAKFGSEPHQLNTWVFHAPYVWLPSVLVASALLGHVLIFKKLLTKSPSAESFT